MKKIKIAYISTTGLDVFPLITALEELETEKVMWQRSFSDPKMIWPIQRPWTIS